METKMQNEESTFFNVAHREENKKETAIVGIIKNHMAMLEEDLYTTELEYAREHRKNKYSESFYAKELACKMIEAKMDLLKRLQADFEEMLSIKVV